jgi:radical SAM/Cys-rich protein
VSSAFKIDPPFVRRISAPLMAQGIETLQINTGYRCNLQCRHCHVAASPSSTEIMSRETLEQCLNVLRDNPIPIIDITGGSPEMHPHMEWFLRECSGLGRRLMLRSNGVILLEKEYQFFVDLFAACRLEVIVSLPHLNPENTDRQRGDGAFDRLICALQGLNRLGYGRPHSDLVLNLVHNPSGAYLPGSQGALEANYRDALGAKYGIIFNHLFSITNMPIGRYLDFLLKSDNYEDYMNLLVQSFNPKALDAVMCKTTLSVAWDGRLYDCDFNQMLGLTTNHGAPDHISAFDMAKLERRQIVVDNHCYGCTAGQGSSCGGALKS